MEDAGDLALGAYFIGGSTAILNPPDSIDDERTKFQAETYQTKAAEYGLAASEMEKGFAAQAYVGMMSLWDVTSRIVAGGDELTPESITQAYAETDGDHMFGSAPLSCSTAPEPYIAVCNGEVEATQWDGEQLKVVRDRFTGVDLVAGTELKTGP